VLYLTAKQSPAVISSKQCLRGRAAPGHAGISRDHHESLSHSTSGLDMKMRTPERNQSHMLPDPTSAEICPQKDVNGQQENSIDIANSLPQGLFLDAGESPFQGSSLLLGQGGRRAGGQTAEPQV